MNIKKDILNVLFLVAFCMSPCLVHSAADTSCDNDNNEYINQRLALCNVHAYNIGITENPADANSRQLMNDVVALKSTIIAQQLKKQYDFLDATVKRFQVQMKKAILTAELEAAGAAPGDNGTTSKTGGVSYLSCAMKGSTDTISCVRQNISEINREIANKADTMSVTATVRRQLVSDAVNVGSLGQAPANCKETDIKDVRSAKTCMQNMNGAMIQLENKTRSTGWNMQNERVGQ